MFELYDRSRLNLGCAGLAKAVNQIATERGILEQPLPDPVDMPEGGARRRAELHREVGLVGDGETAAPYDSHHFANDPERLRDVDQEISAEHDVERPVSERQLRRIALLKPHVWWILGVCRRVVGQCGVVLQADAGRRLQGVGEASGRVALSTTEIQAVRGRDARQSRKDLTRCRVQNLVEQVLTFRIPLVRSCSSSVHILELVSKPCSAGAVAALDRAEG